MLRPLPVPTKCWESVSMDFMTHLPEFKGFDPIMVVVNRVSQMAHFVSTWDTEVYESFLACALEEIGHGIENEHSLLTSN